MRRSNGHYHSHNKFHDDHFRATFKCGQSLVDKAALDGWLTERYALFQDRGESINEFQIHHIEWPLKEIKLSVCEVDYPRFSKLLNGPPRKVHYSPGVQVIAWGREPVRDHFATIEFSKNRHLV